MIPKPLKQTLDDLNALSQFFIKAEADMKNGIFVDLTGIDKRVAELCQAVQSAIPEQQEAYIPELNNLISLLDSCEMALRQLPVNDTEDPVSLNPPFSNRHAES